MNRRTFLHHAALATITSPSLFAQTDETIRVAVIGHTGRGNYGHGLDTVWQQIPGTQIVGVADADPKGLEKALKRLNVETGFADYQEMLQTVQPDYVSVCPRHADQHHAMTVAAIKSGVKGVYVEKPFCRTPAEADEIVSLSDASGTKIAVAHRNRYHPTLAVIDRFIANGDLGKLLEIRGRGKGDRRGGDEDLWVLGSHVLNLVSYFGGTPQSCSAIMKRDEHRVTKEHLREGPEGLGPLAANELHARYELSNGVIATFDSIANDGTQNAGFGLQLIGSKGIIQIQCDLDPLAHWIPGNPFRPTKTARPWIPISSSGVGKEENQGDLIAEVQHHIASVRDLIQSVRDNRTPLCDAREGRTTLEMICGVFESHRKGGRSVAIPLIERDHPLTKL